MKTDVKISEFFTEFYCSCSFLIPVLISEFHDVFVSESSDKMATMQSLFGLTKQNYLPSVLMFWKLTLYKPSTLLKKPSDSWKKASDFLWSCATNAFWKNVPNIGVIFLDVYCIAGLGF